MADEPRPSSAQSVLPPDWQQIMQAAVQSGVERGIAFAMSASGNRVSEETLMSNAHLDNFIMPELKSISEGESDMAQRKERVQVGKDKTGKPIYKWAYGTTKPELQMEIARLLMESGALGATSAPILPVKPKVPTVKEFVEETYKPAFIDSLRKTTQSTYNQYLSLNILPFLGDMRMDEVTVATIQLFYNWMASAGERGRKKNLNEQSIHRISGLTSRIFKVALEMHIIDDTPFKKTLLRIDAEDAGHHTALPDKDVLRIKLEIPQLENDDERKYMALLAFTGMRPEEVRGLDWRDLCLDQQYGRIFRTVTYPDNNKPYINKPKTDRSGRTVLLPKIVVNILKPFQQESGFVCGGKEPWCYSKAYRVSKKAFKNLQIVGYTDYDFRTTFGTQMKESGKTSAQVADLLGHADTRMVETVYARTRHEGVLKQLRDVEELGRSIS